MASPGLEPETFSVLDWRDNQLHHDTGCVCLTRFNYKSFLQVNKFSKATWPSSLWVDCLTQLNSEYRVIWIKRVWTLNLGLDLSLLFSIPLLAVVSFGLLILSPSSLPLSLSPKRLNPTSISLLSFSLVGFYHRRCLEPRLTWLSMISSSRIRSLAEVEAGAEAEAQAPVLVPPAVWTTVPPIEPVHTPLLRSDLLSVLPIDFLFYLFFFFFCNSNLCEFYRLFRHRILRGSTTCLLRIRLWLSPVNLVAFEHLQ